MFYMAYKIKLACLRMSIPHILYAWFQTYKTMYLAFTSLKKNYTVFLDKCNHTYRLLQHMSSCASILFFIVVLLQSQVDMEFENTAHQKHNIVFPFETSSCVN